MESDVVAASISILEEGQQAARPAAGADGDRANDLFSSVLHGTVWESLEKGCHEQRALQDSEMIARYFIPYCAALFLQWKI